MSSAVVFDFQVSHFIDKKKFRELLDSNYLPILKLIKNSKNSVFTLNLPLSFLERCEIVERADVIDIIKSLEEQGKVELTGTSAYNVPLNTSHIILESEILLNELSLGYYFGKPNHFDGEPSFVLKDLKGFVNTNFYTDVASIHFLKELGYEWLLIDVNQYKDLEPKGLFNFNKFKLLPIDLKFQENFTQEIDINNLDLQSNMTYFGPQVLAESNANLLTNLDVFVFKKTRVR